MKTQGLVLMDIKACSVSHCSKLRWLNASKSLVPMKKTPRIDTKRDITVHSHKHFLPLLP